MSSLFFLCFFFFIFFIYYLFNFLIDKVATGHNINSTDAEFSLYTREKIISISDEGITQNSKLGHINKSEMPNH